MAYGPAQVWKVLSGGSTHPRAKRFLEDAGETFKQGTPVVVQASDGYLIESPTISSALKIAGFSQEPGANLTTDGVPKTLTYGSVINQPLAVLIPGGAPMNDGRCGVWLAADETLFITTVKATQTPAITDVGLIYGLTKDATTGYWYIDKDIVLAASGAIAEIVEIPVIPGNSLAPSTPVAGGLIVFKITKAGQQFSI